MGKALQIRVDSILGGQSPTRNFAFKTGQYDAAFGIDPDFPSSDTSSDVRISGYLRPTSIADFSDTALNGTPLWLLTQPKTSTVYAYLGSGRVLSYSQNFLSETTVSSLSTASGGGAAYYDNYLYFARNTDVARYGPLDGSPSMTTDYWTNTLSKTALTNNTYPSLYHTEALPNHVMHAHTDSKLYFCDVHADGRGIVSYIKTTKTTVQGDTDNGSSYNALDFPFGHLPVCLETYQTDLVIGIVEGTNDTIKQTKARIAFWDTTSSSFQKITSVELPDSTITALKNVNGVLYAWLGNNQGGYRVVAFRGGYTFEEVYYQEDGTPPFQGAVDHDLNRFYWGDFIQYPASTGVVRSTGSKNRQLGFPTHIPFRVPVSGTGARVTAVKLMEHASGNKVRPIVGWNNNSSNYGIGELSTTYGSAQWRSEVFRIGQPFEIKRIRIPLAQAMAANMTITPKVLVDNNTTSKTLTVLNNTNFPNSEMAVTLKPEVSGETDFQLDLKWSGSALCTVALPIVIDVELKDY